MKKSFFLSMLLATFVAFSLSKALAGSGLPADAYRVDELGAALHEAKTDGWPITFLFTSLQTTCVNSSRANFDVINELKQDTIIVYVDATKNELGKCPRNVVDALTSRKAGRVLPIAVIFDSRGKNLVDVVPFVNPRSEHVERLQKACDKASKPPSLFTRMKYKVMDVLD